MADTLDMQDGKNFYLDIFQCEAPQTTIQAMRTVVGDETAESALDLVHSLKSMEERSQYDK
jgi:hypothetical protein